MSNEDVRSGSGGSSVSRRGVLAAGGATAFVVAGCSATARVVPAASGVDAAVAAEAIPLGPANSVPVGGGRVFPQQGVVVTQPAAGEFRAFSSVCTHRGCSVTAVTDGAIDCRCHGSKFSISDGSVLAGPAKAPLPARAVTADRGTLRLG